MEISTNQPRTYETGITRWLIVIAVMMVAVIEVLDTTIVNVALSHMMGALGATRDQITWVLTSYIVAAAIVMPLTGFLVDKIGRKKLLLIDIGGFLVSSMLCGISHSLAEIVLFRVLQGAFGASLIPLSQYVLIDTFPKEERGKAMAIWGIGIMTGPVLGPTLGGYITDIWNWRWIFYINLPICIIAFLMTMEVIKETPIRERNVDWVGLFWMVVGVGTLQIFLDRGETDDWFHSNYITALMITSAITLTIFVVRGLQRNNNIINLHLFRNSNFRRCSLILVLFAMGVFSVLALQPIMMQQLMGYSASEAGLVMAPRGLSSALSMMIVGRFITVIDPRWFLIVGLVILEVTTYWMTSFNLDTSFHLMAKVSFFQGFGVGLFFVPLATIVFNTLDPSQEAEASGIFNFSRNLGTSMGISLVSTFLSRQSQLSWSHLSDRLTATNANLQNWLQTQHLTLSDPKALAYFNMQLAKQSSMVAFVNTFKFVEICFLIALPLIFLLKKPPVIHSAVIE